MDDVRDGRLADAELFGDRLLVDAAAFAHAAYREDGGARQLGLPVLLSVKLCVAPLPDGVLRVVLGRAEEEMRGVDAGADVAAVEHQPVVINSAVLDEVADAVRLVLLIVDADDAVTVLA